MKGLVTETSGQSAVILFDGQLPDVGAYYFLESAQGGTNAQNKAFHALVMEYWKSGQHSYNASSYLDFRNQIKRHLGAGFEAYIYIEMVSGVPIIKDAKSIDDIPDHVRNYPDFRDIIRGRLKSWSDYTLKERKSTIDNLIADMIQAGVNTKKFQDIMEGLEK